MPSKHTHAIFLSNPNPFKSGYHMINVSLFVNIAYLYDFLVWFHVLKFFFFEFVYRVLLNFYRKLVELLYISLAQVNGKILSANAYMLSFSKNNGPHWGLDEGKQVALKLLK